MTLLLHIGLNCSFKLKFGQDPIVVLFVDDWVWDLDLWVLAIELLLSFLAIESWKSWCWIHSHQFLLSLIELTTIVLEFLGRLELVICLCSIGIISNELLLSLQNELLSIQSTLGLLINLGLTSFSISLCDSLSSNDILFSQVNGTLEPLEKLTKAWVVLVNLLLLVVVNKTLAVVNGLKTTEFALFLIEHLVL